jgi:hypothetical protein
MMKMRKMDIPVFCLATVSGLAGSFVITGLFGLAVQFIRVGPERPEMFGWFGLFVVVGMNCAILCVPACLILAGFLIARPYRPVEIAKLFLTAGCVSIVGSVLCLPEINPRVMAAIVALICACIAVVLGIAGRRKRQNKGVENTGTDRADSSH